MAKKPPKKSVISPEDLDAFAQAVQGIKPLAQRKVQHEAVRKYPKRREMDIEPPASFFDGGDPKDSVQSDDFIAYNQSGISHKTLRNLRKGQYNVEAVLDLHRNTIEEARVAVERFLHECLQNELRTVLIVHGKGKPGVPPILKNHVNHWLRQATPVLAFCSSTSRHGGNGAVYVLLKRAKEGKSD